MREVPLQQPIDFYFDFSSPYGYLAAELIESVAAKHLRQVAWHPILLGVVFKVTGSQPLTEIPVKGDYSKHDFARSARFYGVPYRMPDRFPVATQNAARAFIWLHDQDAAAARRFAQAVLRAYFVDNRDITDLQILGGIAQTLGVADGLERAVADPVLKDRLRAANAEAQSRGVFGSPFFFVDGEPFWGVDRLPQIERWLQSGPF
ncbi:MAG: 2-hydroxychromene-2-carboxylate isomerase [Rhodocyclaceae bacterium]